MEARWNPVFWIANGFGAGLIPWAPGTFGTLVAIPIYLGLLGLPMWLYLLVVLVALLAGIGVCSYVARQMGENDHPSIVWDEIVGFLITMIAAPTGWLWIAIGFVLFRLFDIWKPWPIRLIDQRVKGGAGIMLDDVLAAGYALVILQVLYVVTGSK